MNEILITYGSDTDINYPRHPQTFYGTFKQFDFSVEVPQTVDIRDGCHKDIKDGKDVFTD